MFQILKISQPCWTGIVFHLFPIVEDYIGSDKSYCVHSIICIWFEEVLSHKTTAWVLPDVTVVIRRLKALINEQNSRT